MISARNWGGSSTSACSRNDSTNERNASLLRTVSARTTEPSVRVLPGDGGWYAVLQVPTLGSEEDLVLDLLATDEVLVHPGYFFDFPRESFLIVSLLPPPAAFARGIERLLRHFACSVGRP